MADYPNALYNPTTLVDGSDYPLAAHINNPNAEIEAIETALGVNPTTIDDTVSPGASPASVAAYLDMVANILKTMSGQSNWYDADVQMALATQVKGRVEFMNASVPTTVAATQNALVGASSPAEQYLYWDFINGSATYVEFLCRLVGYNGGGLTLSALVMRTTGAAAETYIFEAAIRRITAASEEIGASHTYDYNAVTVTIPAGPPAASIPMAVTITFTDGADMDSLANGEFFYLRFRRNGGTATDTARVLAGISVVET